MQWENEPNEKDWMTEAGIRAYILRNSSMGHLCGYIAVPESHPWHGKDYDDVEPYPSVHGGLTYAKDRAPLKKPDGHWWLGFDCAHADDLIPLMRLTMPNDVCRSFGYVESECEHLAAQAIKATLETPAD